MKKILFASTALLATAGIAAAEVSVSGDGRMGVTYLKDRVLTDGNGDPYSAEWQFTSRIRIKFAASGETDGGIATTTMTRPFVVPRARSSSPAPSASSPWVTSTVVQKL